MYEYAVSGPWEPRQESRPLYVVRYRYAVERMESRGWWAKAGDPYVSIGSSHNSIKIEINILAEIAGLGTYI